MFRLFAIYLKESGSLGRGEFFLRTMLIMICMSFLKKFTGSLTLAEFMIYLASIPFMLAIVYRRINDIEKGRRRHSNLFKIWLWLTCILIVMNYYVAFYPIDKTHKWNLLWLTPPIVCITMLHIYLLCKRGEKAISAEREEQARMRDERDN